VLGADSRHTAVCGLPATRLTAPHERKRAALRALLRKLLRRWQRSGPPQHYGGPDVSAIQQQLPRLLAAEPGAEVEQLRSLPPLAELYWLPTRPSGHARFTAQADSILAGQFRPANRWEPKTLGFPPPWDSDSFGDDNWLSTLHGLEWLIPLVHAHAGDPEKGYLEKATLAIQDWILHNPFRKAPSRFSWHDHAAAKRLRLFAWFWELYRKSEDFDAYFARLLLASVYQHALYHLDDRNYRPNSNHGLEGIGALWSGAVTFPFFRDASAWEAKAQERLEQWLADNLSPEGFHLEQSPSYHWFVLLRLAAIDRFLCANGRPLDDLSRAAERAAQVWPYLLKPNGAVPTVGDSSPTAPANWRDMLERRWGRAVPPPAGSSADAGCTNGGTFITSPKAGYAIFRSGGPGDEGSEQDIHVVFRCRAFVSPHCHYDVLSFVLCGLGRDWLIDPGYLSYHERDPRRQYLRSPRAHSLVLIGDQDFRVGRNDVVDWGVTAEGAHAVAYHDVPRGRHTRRVLLASSGDIVVRDEIVRARRRWFPWSQLFQVAPDLDVAVVSDREAHLCAQDGSRCVVHQDVGGQWRVVRGQERPRLQGWYSPGYGQWEPGTTLFFDPPRGVTQVQSRLTLEQSGSST
jgi:hypothetical protein